MIVVGAMGITGDPMNVNGVDPRGAIVTVMSIILGPDEDSRWIHQKAAWIQQTSLDIQ